MSELTAEAALKLVGEIFVYHMPFNRALGLELERYEKAFAQLSFNNQPMMVGNWAQSILHGGVIASALDVAAGLVCVGSTLTRHDTINEEELRQRLSRMGRCKPGTINNIYSLLLPYIPGDTATQAKPITHRGIYHGKTGGI